MIIFIDHFSIKHIFSTVSISMKCIEFSKLFSRTNKKCFLASLKYQNKVDILTKEKKIEFEISRKMCAETVLICYVSIFTGCDSLGENTSHLIFRAVNDPDETYTARAHQLNPIPRGGLKAVRTKHFERPSVEHRAG